MFGLSLDALLGQVLFALEQRVQLQLVAILELLQEGAAVLDQLTHGLFQGARDVQ